MSDARDPAPLIEAAQNAVGESDYLEAERLLREAVAIHEAQLGPTHPDLATTLNNLAFVCERTGKFDEAERGYRRAHKIAVASLSPGHPFIKTSLSNLMEFCEARGIPIWTRPETPVEDEPLPDDGDVDVEPLHEDADVEPSVIDVAPDLIPEPAAASQLPFRTMAAVALVAAALVVIFFTRQGQGTTSEPRAVVPDRTESTPPVKPAMPDMAATVPPRAPEPTPEPAAPAKKVIVPNPPPRREPANANASVTVLTAQLCSGLEKRGTPDWHCTSASGDLRPGTYRFYTRLLVASATTVEHRWSSMAVSTRRCGSAWRRVQATGYRTFSATTVSPERAGEWKVELRAADGTVLDQESFLVR